MSRALLSTAVTVCISWHKKTAWRRFLDGFLKSGFYADLPGETYKALILLESLQDAWVV